ncbi:glycosyltransferase family 4 protein [bacterium]|nr:glycosyltransferase family 4 protein [bacterium]
MIKVLHIVTAFPRSDDEDSMTPWLISLLRGLERRGVKNTVFAPSYKGLGNQTVFGIDVRRYRYFFRKYEDLTHDEATPVRLSRKPWYLLWVPFMLISGRRALKKLLKEEHFDIVHIHWPIPMAFVGAPAFDKLPVVFRFYSAEIVLAKRYPKIFSFFLKKYINKADAISANSSYTASLIKNFRRDVEVIPDVNFFPNVTPKFAEPLNNNPKKILFVGRIVERKGVKYLIRAMPKVLSRIDAELIVVGSGAILDELKSTAQDIGVSEKVHFTGVIPADEKEQYYKNCDVFVLPACFDRHGDTEGLGVVLLEALSYGKPVIASAVGGIVDIVKDGHSGLLVPEKDPDALAEAIIRVLTDKELYIKLAKDGYEYAIQKFSPSVVEKAIVDVYEALLKK